MSEAVGSTIVIGGASPLGVCLVEHISRTSDIDIIVIDEPSRFEFIEHLAEALTDDPLVRGRVTAMSWRQENGFPYLPSQIVRELAADARYVLEVGFQRDRSVDSFSILHRNPSLFRLALEIAGNASSIESLVITTDVGVTGDYPGRFYENWTDAEQAPFDAVDATSLDVEKLALQSQVPIVRGRLGVLSDPDRPILWGKHWKPAALTLLPHLHILRRLPRHFAIPMAIAEKCKAPLTPIEWAARALWALAQNPHAVGSAFHLIMWHKPSMIDVLQALTARADGARITNRLPRRSVEGLSRMPGMHEIVRVRFDHMASFWTPNRYCLSVNDLDTSLSETVLGAGVAPPSWGTHRETFFKYLD